MPTRFEVDLLEPRPVNGLTVPMIRMTEEEDPPDADVVVGETAFVYDRSYPIKGHSAVLPRYLREQLGAGKKPLLIERPTRLYVYFEA